MHRDSNGSNPFQTHARGLVLVAHSPLSVAQYLAPGPREPREKFAREKPPGNRHLLCRHRAEPKEGYFFPPAPSICMFSPSKTTLRLTGPGSALVRRIFQICLAPDVHSEGSKILSHHPSPKDENSTGPSPQHSHTCVKTSCCTTGFNNQPVPAPFGPPEPSRFLVSPSTTSPATVTQYCAVPPWRQAPWSEANLLLLNFAG